MKWTDPIIISGKEYKFEDIEQEPLLLVMRIDEKYSLWRDISADTDSEKWTLTRTYSSVINSVVKKGDKYSVGVYCGRTIVSPSFIKELLEHVLHDVI